MDHQSPFQKPSEYMRSRRPELFSDSKESQSNTLPRTHLEYVLETITSQSKEKNFEYFCRKICEKEIAPNLIPQTGPTGGGDSKADTETYPVADSIAETWYTHEALQSANERWAFAFSAKKDWKPKLKSDVKGVAETGRDYQRIYFVSNQFIKDKDRAALEDELSKLYNTSVRILSREWLVEKVYSNNHLDIAISTLDIQGYSSASDKVLGQKDYKRTQELEELENNIKDTTRYNGVAWQLADDSLRVAQLMRGLGKSKDDIINAFLRAGRIAENHNLAYHLFKVNYHLAWTHFFWFDDIKELLRIYPAIEKYCETTNQIDDIEKLSNLFNLVYGHFLKGLIDKNESNIEPKRDLLLELLRKFANEIDRPATSLFAKSLLAMLEFTISQRIEDVGKLNEEYLMILNESEGLIDFPLERILNFIKELSDVLEKADNYENLFNRTVEITQKLESDLVAGDLVFDRARKNFLNSRYNDAIRLFGKSILYFAKDEYVNELTLSLYGIAKCYKQQGLIWAARNSYVSAIERSLSVFWKERKLLPRLPWLIKNLMQIEIEIGRPIHVMHWRELLGAILANTQLSDDEKKKIDNDLNMQDIINAILLLKTPFAEFNSLKQLPDLYDSLDMPFSRTAVLYALGHLDVIRSDKFIPDESSTDDKLDEYITLWRKQPASKQIANQPLFEDTDLINLRSRLLSVDLNIVCKNNTSVILLGEMIFGVLEAMWATAIEEGIYPHRKKLNVYIEESSNSVDEILQTRSEVRNGETSLVVEYNNFDLSSFSTIDDRHKIKDKIFEAVVMIFSHIAYASDLGQKIEKIFGKEGANSRALAFSDLYIAISSIFGKEHSFTTNRWLQKSGTIKTYDLLRASPLGEVDVFPLKDEEEGSEPQPGPPEELLHPEKTKHGSHHIESLIDADLWNKAKWRATGFILHPQLPPHLLLGFEDYESGKHIFTGIKNKIGSVDVNGKIRLVIIKGIDKRNPHAYAVVFSSNLNESKEASKTFLILSRINRMEPQNSTNLDNFERAYKSANICVLAPCSVSNLMPERQYIIQLKEVIIRNAWEIGENDMDIMGLPEDCDPIVPDGVIDPPYLKSLRFKKRK